MCLYYFLRFLRAWVGLFQFYMKMQMQMRVLSNVSLTCFNLLPWFSKGNVIVSLRFQNTETSRIQLVYPPTQFNIQCIDCVCNKFIRKSKRSFLHNHFRRFCTYIWTHVEAILTKINSTNDLKRTVKMCLIYVYLLSLFQSAIKVLLLIVCALKEHAIIRFTISGPNH